MCIRDSGHPVRGDGNVGWSVAIEHPALARATAAHLSRWWAQGGPPAADVPPAALATSSPGAVAPPWRPIDGRVTLLVSPSNAWRSEGVPAAVVNATSTLDLLLLQLRPHDNPWWDAVAARAHAGVPTRMLLNGVPLGVGHDPWRDGGGAAVAAWTAAALEVRASDPGGPAVHAKALVVDGRTVLVGSSNWGSAGLRTNRELGLLIEDEGLGALAADAFARAWASSRPAEPGALPPAPAATPGALALLAAACAVVLRPRRG